MSCVEQGLILFRIRSELLLTMDYYRRVYESAVAFGASKSLDNKLELDHSRQLIEELQSQVDELRNGNPIEPRMWQFHEKSKQKSATLPHIGASESDRVLEYYDRELAKKDEIIRKQRAIIEALSKKSVSQIKDPF